MTAPRGKFGYIDTEMLVIGAGSKEPIQCRATVAKPLIICGASGEQLFVDEDGNVSMGSSAADAKLDVTGAIKIAEQAAADGDTAGKGQIWVKNTTPCELWFTDDAGTDTQIV